MSIDVNEWDNNEEDDWRKDDFDDNEVIELHLHIEALQVRVIRPQAYKSEKAWKSLMAQKVIGRWIRCWGFIYKLIRA